MLLAIFRTTDQVDRLHMSHIDLVPQDIGEDDLREVFLLLVTVEVAILELLSDVGHLPIDPFLL